MMLHIMYAVCADEEEEEDSEEESGKDWDQLEEEARKGEHRRIQTPKSSLFIFTSFYLYLSPLSLFSGSRGGPDK